MVKKDPVCRITRDDMLQIDESFTDDVLCRHRMRRSVGYLPTPESLTLL